MSSPASRRERTTPAYPSVAAITGSVTKRTRCPCRAATPPAAAAMPLPKSTSAGLRRTASSGIGLQEVGEDTEELLLVLERGHVPAARERVQPRVPQLLEQGERGELERREPVVRAVHQQHRRDDGGERVGAEREVAHPALTRRREERGEGVGAGA